MREVEPREEPLKVLFYGLPGSTKTRTAATACNDPRTSPVLYLEAGGNPIALRDYVNKPKILHIDSMEDFNPIYDWIIGGQQLDHPLCVRYHLTPPYRTLMIDQITDVQRMVNIKSTGSTGTALMPGTSPNLMGWPAFNATLQHMIKFAQLFWEIPTMHIIITCQEHTDRDEKTGLVSYKPLLQGQSANEVPGYAYLVARLVHMTKVTTDPKMRAALGEVPESANSVALFMPSSQYVAKDQYGMTDKDGNRIPFMVDPSIPKILDLIYGPGHSPAGIAPIE